MWERRVRQWKMEKMARQKLLEEVVEARRQQIQQRRTLHSPSPLHTTALSALCLVRLQLVTPPLPSNRHYQSNCLEGKRENIRSVVRSAMYTHMNRPNSSLDCVLSHCAHFTVLRFIFVSCVSVYNVCVPPFPQIDIIGAMVIVWRVRGKIIRYVLCNIVCNNCAQCDAHTL